MAETSERALLEQNIIPGRIEAVLKKIEEIRFKNKNKPEKRKDDKDFEDTDDDHTHDSYNDSVAESEDGKLSDECFWLVEDLKNMDAETQTALLEKFFEGMEKSEFNFLFSDYLKYFDKADWVRILSERIDKSGFSDLMGKMGDDTLNLVFGNFDEQAITAILSREIDPSYLRQFFRYLVASDLQLVTKKSEELLGLVCTSSVDISSKNAAIEGLLSESNFKKNNFLSAIDNNLLFDRLVATGDIALMTAIVVAIPELKGLNENTVEAFNNNPTLRRIAKATGVFVVLSFDPDLEKAKKVFKDKELFNRLVSIITSDGEFGADEKVNFFNDLHSHLHPNFE